MLVECLLPSSNWNFLLCGKGYDTNAFLSVFAGVKGGSFGIQSPQSSGKLVAPFAAADNSTVGTSFRIFL